MCVGRSDVAIPIGWALEVIVGGGHVDGPSELVALRFIVDLFDRNIVLFAPAKRRRRFWNFDIN